MKKVLITGAGSFVGTYVENYLRNWPDKYKVSVIDTIEGSWKSHDFSLYDSVYHVAGLAHADVGHVTEEVKAKYYAINTDLAIEVAQKAKSEGVKQFIFMSSAIVYGDSAPIGQQKVIHFDTPVSPANFYGDSKVKAENGLKALMDNTFKVVILRCPMIYGKNSKGNYPMLEKIAKSLLLFPKVDNQRSMLFIGNLAEFVRLMIENEESGIFWPCNAESSNTSSLVKMMANCNGRNIILVPGFEWLLKFLSHFTGYVNKAFGNLIYDATLGNYKEDYRLYSLIESIRETEDLQGGSAW